MVSLCPLLLHREASVGFTNPPCESGCWGGGSVKPWAPGHVIVSAGKWTLFLFYFKSDKYLSLAAAKHAALQSAWERVFFWMFRRFLKNNVIFAGWEEADTPSRTNKPRPPDRCRRPAQRGEMPPVQRTMSDLRTRSEGMYIHFLIKWLCWEDFLKPLNSYCRCLLLQEGRLVALWKLQQLASKSCD